MTCLRAHTDAPAAAAASVSTGSVVRPPSASASSVPTAAQPTSTRIGPVIRAPSKNSADRARSTAAPGGRTPPFFPNCKKIAFVSYKANASSVCTIGVGGSHRHCLAPGTSAGIDSLDVSPDGSAIVFGVYGPSVYVMRADGTHQRRLAKGIDPVFSPNGERIAFSTYLGKIIVMMADGSDKHALIPNPLPFRVTDPSQLAIGQPSWGPKP
jgi:hypothetical protein